MTGFSPEKMMSGACLKN